LRLANNLTFTSLEEIYQQDYVIVLRYTDDEHIRMMRPGSCLISMLHYPTRPKRVELLRSLGIEAISLDSLHDDSGKRLVENLKAVAWNGIEVAFQTLRLTYPNPGLVSPNRPPVHVTLMGAGAVGINVVQAAIRYGDLALHKQIASAGIPGVQVSVVDYDITPHESIMRDLLQHTDILVDATQRPDPSQPVIPNDWVGFLPEHAVILDLSVDPYDCDSVPRSMKGVEGITQGNLDQFVFSPSDPAFDNLPDCVNTTNRRYTVSCYSWPGIHPKECMDVYGLQLGPILRTLIKKGGTKNIHPDGNPFERAISRAMLSRWQLN
jgi:alanine dehydrogenase